MSLVFGAGSTDKVEVNAAAAIDDFAAFSMVVWIRPTTFTTGGRRLFYKGSNTQAKTANWNINAGCNVQVDRATTDAISTSANSSFSTNTWYCICVTYDETNGAKIYSGTLSAAMAEVSYSSAPTVGSGSTLADNGGNWAWGNKPAALSAAAHIGQIAWGAYFNAVLSGTDMEAMRSFPYKAKTHANCVMLHTLGFATAGTQRDYVGANDGTVTGATLDIHVPKVTHLALV